MSDHVVPRRIYFAIFLALIVLTGVTVAVAYNDLGPMNAVVAITIACIKAALVVLHFMHVRYTGRLIWVFIGVALVWFAILIALTMADYASRGWSASG